MKIDADVLQDAKKIAGDIRFVRALGVERVGAIAAALVAVAAEQEKKSVVTLEYVLEVVTDNFQIIHNDLADIRRKLR